MHNCWLVLLPPLIVIALAFIIKNIRLSLFSGILAAGFIAHDFEIIPSIKSIAYRLWEVTEIKNFLNWDIFWTSDKLFICAFLLFLGIIIVLLQHSGGAYAYSSVIMRLLGSNKSAESSSLALSHFFFLDDYFSSLTVGSVMQPLTDRFRVPRVKIALLVSAIAAPMSVLIPLSSWVPYIVSQLQLSGISLNTNAMQLIQCDPFYFYLKMIPFLLYPLIIVATLWFIVRKRITFGLLSQHERIATKTGNLFGDKQPIIRRMREYSTDIEHASWFWDFLFPMITLIGLVVIGSLYGGNYWLLGGENSFLDALKQTNIQAALFVSSVITVMVTFLLLLIRKRIKIKEVGTITHEGIMLLGPSTITLLLIWVLASLVKNDLATGTYIALLVKSHLPVINTALLPALFFIIGAFVANMMGSAWGSMGILFPIAIPMILTLSHLTAPVSLATLPIIIPVIGALISGAIVGSNTSILSDVMLMASTSTGAYHIDLFKLQLSIILPTACSTALAFWLAGKYITHYGLVFTAALSLAAGLVCNIVLFILLHTIWKKFYAK